MSVAGILLAAEPSMFRILEPDHKSLRFSLCSLFHINEHPSAAVGQPIEGVDIVDQHDVAPHLQLQHSLERGIPDSACAVDVELLDQLAGIPGFDGVQFSANFIKLGIVSGVDLGVRPVNVEGIGVNGEFV